MAAKDTSSQPQTAGRAEDTGAAEEEEEEKRRRRGGPEEASTEEASTEEARPRNRERPGNPPGDVGEILDDMDEALEENAEEIVRSFVQQGGQSPRRSQPAWRGWPGRTAGSRGGRTPGQLNLSPYFACRPEDYARERHFR